MIDNILQKYFLLLVGYDDVNDDIDMFKILEGIFFKDEFDLLYNSKYELEDFVDEESFLVL